MRTHSPIFVAVLTLSLAACLARPDPESNPAAAPSPETPASPRTPHLDQPSHFSALPDAPDSAPEVVHGAPDTPTGIPDDPQPAAVPLAAGWTDAGDPVLFDSATGALIAGAPGGDLGGERDLVVDPWLARLLVFESDAEDPWGEIASYPLVAAGSGLLLGPRQHQVWVDGVARLAASPFGAVVFEDGYGPRWRLLRSDGQPSASVFGPRPASLQTTLLADGGFGLTALTYGPDGDSPDLRVATLLPDGVATPVMVPLPVLPLSRPLSARWVESAAGGQVVDVASGDVLVSASAGEAPVLMPLGVGPGIERVEQAATFPGGGRLALLTSGAANLVVATVGAGGAPGCAAALALPGEPGKAGLFFARGLLVVGPERVLVATSSGVFAIAVSDECPPLLALDLAFDGEALRGPLDLTWAAATP